MIQGSYMPAAQAAVPREHRQPPQLGTGGRCALLLAELQQSTHHEALRTQCYQAVLTGCSVHWQPTLQALEGALCS